MAGATWGIGAGMTLALLRQPAMVMATGRREEQLARLAHLRQERWSQHPDSHMVNAGDARQGFAPPDPAR